MHSILLKGDHREKDDLCTAGPSELAADLPFCISYQNPLL
ncbi:hypothetical protein E6C60_1059 [Paenibacillus algicola]|uniref:Uncharacterized protein n=1 Tax=Paenibacillus algicola TaxID=2565926 RepID=A0A4P8XGY0_9BACL|nr:hypothetical protein E6C60_1059 [Paenibacillus algicola]